MRSTSCAFAAATTFLRRPGRSCGRTRPVVVEIDGALHLIVRRWRDDQLRQHEIVLGADAILLRFPSIVVRTDERVVVAQLRRALFP